MTDSDGAGVRPSLTGEDLLAPLGLSEAGWDVRVEAVRQLPGAHLGIEDVLAVARQAAELDQQGADGVVVVQGTDTLEETSFVVDLLYRGDAPIVFTGAMRHPSAPGADGPANLLASLRTAASPLARGHGVLVCLNDELHAAVEVLKAHASRPSAFCSPPAGPVGWVAEDRVRLGPARRSPVAVGAESIAERPQPAVHLHRIVLGDDGRAVDAVMALGYGGLVVEAFGAGHVTRELAEVLGRHAEQVPVVLASRTGAGEVFRATYGFEGSERDLLDRGLIPAPLGGLKSRLILALGLRAGWDREQLAGAFEGLAARR